MSEFLIIVLTVIIIAQQVWHGYQTQILVNKLMSRNYAEYEASKPLKPEETPEQQEPARDLSYLNSMIAR